MTFVRPYGRQQIDDDDVAAVAAVLRSDFLTTGPVVPAFEAALAEVVGARFAVVCSSGTAALHLAMAALGIGSGDVVIVPTITFVATANAARMVGAEVVFADVRPEDGLMGADELEAAVGRAKARGRAKAVVPVHLGGQCWAPDVLQEVARKHQLVVIEDACHSLGTTYAGQARVGACRHSDAAVFSFHPVKTVAMGEGGAITTNDAAIDAHMRRFRSHGIERDAGAFLHKDMALDGRGATNPWYYEMPSFGFNYRASDINCALGLSQLRKLPRFRRARQELVRQYDRALAPLAPAVRSVAPIPNCDATRHLYTVLFDFAAIGKDRAQVMNELRDRGVGTQVHYIPVHQQPYYRERYGATHLAGAEAYYRRCLSLPLYVGMTATDVGAVADAVRAVVA